jgi:fructokinase
MAAIEITKASWYFIYGALCRDNIYETLYELLKLAKIFDVNLRAPYYTIDVLSHLMNEANFVKV